MFVAQEGSGTRRVVQRGRETERKRRAKCSTNYQNRGIKGKQRDQEDTQAVAGEPDLQVAHRCYCNNGKEDRCGKAPGSTRGWRKGGKVRPRQAERGQTRSGTDTETRRTRIGSVLSVLTDQLGITNTPIGDGFTGNSGLHLTLLPFRIQLLDSSVLQLSRPEVDRGSFQVVVPVLWSTKYGLDVSVRRMSHPGGNGPRAACEYCES